MLQGRREERRTLEQLLDRARSGASTTLVLRGDAGIGKTALLDHAAEYASGCRIVRVTGAQTELELPFAGLHQLCAPLFAESPRIPAPQRAALRVAFGLDHGDPPDRFLVALGVLSLLAELAETKPLVCLIDDAQWLDDASRQALAFVARRLLAEPIALLFATRASADDALAGLPALNLTGIDDAAARRLLATAIPGRLDERVRDRIVAEARGNPLALLELPSSLTPAELAGGFGALPLTDRIEQRYERRVGELPGASRLLLLAAAAEPVGDAPLIWRACAALGIAPEALAPAEAAGLVTFGERVRFPHPLARSAVYRTAAADDRRAVHRALADATDSDADPDRRAWHRARAAAGLDESVARELERSAGRAQARGGVAAAAAFLARAAELTPDPKRRGARALTAARAKFDAAAHEDALQLLATAELCPLDGAQRAQLARLRARIAFSRTRGSAALRRLFAAAAALAPFDADAARETYLEGLRATIHAGRLGDVDAGAALRAAPPHRPPPRALDLLLDGLVTRLNDGYAAAVPPLRRALAAFLDERDQMPWLWLACPVAPEPVAPDLWDDGAWHALAARAVALARESGALTALPTALTSRAVVHLHAGEFGAATELIDEAARIAAATGATPIADTSLLLAAWRGDAHRTAELARRTIRDATSRGEGRAIGLAEYASALLHNGRGEYGAALAAAERACAHEDLGLHAWALIELIEAAVRSDAPERAATALTRLEERTTAAGGDWALGILARSRALLDADPDALYAEAIERLAHTRIVVQHARAQLLYGEWLRRDRRRVDAREQLRAAQAAFSRIGAEAFAERARRELAATGETARRRVEATRDALTPQEAQVARMARAGRTNPEIGAQLFISPRTVEYHLRKVYAKLGVSSRKELSQTAGPPGQ